MRKRIYKTQEGAMIAGVCAGLAEFFSVDVTLIRLAVVALTILGAGSGLVAYVVAAIVMPNKGPGDGRWQSTGEEGHYYDKTTVDEGSSNHRRSTQASSSAELPVLSGLRLSPQTLLALILIGVGSYKLLEPHVNLHRLFLELRPFWPLALVVVGLILLAASWRQKN